MSSFNRFCVTVFALILAGLLGSAPARAEEKILKYQVDISAQKNGDFIITETLDVQAQGQVFRRGIERNFPRFLIGKDGEKIVQAYKINSVTLNGKKENYSRTTEGGTLTLRIGNESVFLDPGTYRYEIKYTVPRALRYFADYDEVYWNAIGAFWSVPIDVANVTLSLPQTLPSEGKVLDKTVYWGEQVSGRVAVQGQEIEWASPQDGRLTLKTLRALETRTGLSLAVSVPKGVFDPPSAADLRAQWWMKNGGVSLLSLMLAALAGLYYRRWNAVGRDPIKPAIIPRYGPPKGLSPAGARFVLERHNAGHQSLIATFLHWASLDFVKITTDKTRTEITRLRDMPKREDMAEEADFFEQVFSSGGSLILDKKTNLPFISAASSFDKAIADRYGKNYFNFNAGYPFLGLFLGFGGFLIIGILGLYRAMPAPLIIGAVGAFIALHILAWRYLPAPTPLGQKIRTEIEGFKLYLNTAEKARLNAVKIGMTAPPPMTAEHYGKMLPFAIALGVEKPWTKYFETVLPVEAARYQPHNVDGSFTAGSLSGMTSQMVSAMSSSVSSAAPASSSSSGSSGGGSVGGGGGGGGGGGW